VAAIVGSFVNYLPHPDDTSRSLREVSTGLN
jgi:hypothetical protein